MYGSEQAENTLDFPLLSPTKEPLSLTRVCRRWRAVVLNTPAIWSSFSVRIPMLSLELRQSCPQIRCSGSNMCASLVCHERRSVNVYQQLLVWLTLSRKMPLSFCVFVRGDEGLSNENDGALLTSTVSPWTSNPALRLLAQEVSRWKDVFISGDSLAQLPVVPESLLRDNLLLETLVMGKSCTHDETRLPPTIKELFFHSGAKVTLNPARLAELPELQRLIINHTSCLKDRPLPVHAIEIIKSCSKLERLKLMVDEPPGISPSNAVSESVGSRPRVVSHSLQFMEIYGHPRALIPILNAISLPNTKRENVVIHPFGTPSDEEKRLVKQSLESVFPPTNGSGGELYAPRNNERILI